MRIKKLKNIDLRKLKDSFFKGIEKDKVLEEKTILSIMYEYTKPKGQAVSEKFIQSKFVTMQINLLGENAVRRGEMEAKYTKNGKIKTLKVTKKGIKEAKKLIKK